MDKTEQPDILKDYFDDCKKGEKGVMPYWEGQSVITFVWTNGKGYGRVSKLTLNQEGKKEAWKYYKEIEELNKKVKSGEIKNG